MQHSRVITEDKVYVKFDKQGHTQYVKGQDLPSGFSYRRVHNQIGSQQRKQLLSGKQVFQDQKYQIDKSQLSLLQQNHPQSQRIVLKRLFDICQKCSKNTKHYFFPPKDFIPNRKLSSSPYLPPVSTQIGVFPISYYKSFFITQDFSPNGMYQIIINNNGRFQIDIVDDIIPVRQYSLQPIWQMSLDNCWQIILLKFWAKRNGGYNQVKNTAPFKFLQYFSNSNWKYYNLQIDGFQFLSYYTQKIQHGKFILKTKNTQEVKDSGLIPNSAGYQMINLVQVTQNQQNQYNQKKKPSQRKWIATIRSTMNNKWTGDMSIIDKQVNNKYYPQKYTMALQRDFMIRQHDLVNLFSSAYIASRRDSSQQNYYSDYYILNVAQQNKKAIYFKFDIPQDGWFDFCIRQQDNNRVQPTNKSRYRAQQYNKNEGIDDSKRFLKCKYILVKQNDQSSPSLINNPDYSPLAYDVYEIQYSQGYNRGDARFLNTVRGTYILKIKPQYIQKDSLYVLNYACDSKIQMREYSPPQKQSSSITRIAFASLIQDLQSYSLDKNLRWQEITFANVFDHVGYGFVGVRMKRKCPYQILIDVDPNQVQSSGYKFKNQFKNIDKPFSVMVSPGQWTSLVLKKRKDANNFTWPPQGIQIFKKKLGFINSQNNQNNQTNQETQNPQNTQNP